MLKHPCYPPPQYQNPYQTDYHHVMGETSKYDLTGDDFLSNYNFTYFPRSSSENSIARLDKLSSLERSGEGFLRNGKQVQPSLSAGPPSMLNTVGEAGLPRKDIDVDFHNPTSVAVESTMKKYADNLLRVLEGMNGRLSQLESSVFILNHSMGDLKLSVANSHGKFDASLRSLLNHFTDVQQAAQVLRDKQEIFETHAELVKLQLSKNDPVKDSSGGSFVAEAQVSTNSNSTAHVQSLSPQHGFLAVASSQQSQILQSNQAMSPIFQHSVAMPQTETFMQTNTYPSLPSSNSSVQPQLYSPVNVDMQRSQPLQGLHHPTQHLLPVQMVQQPQLQQPLFMPQQPSVQPAQFHQLQQTYMLRPLPELPQAQVSQSMQFPLQDDQSIQQPSQPSLPAHSLNLQFPKTLKQAQQGFFSESQLQQSRSHSPSQGAFAQNGHHFEARHSVPLTQNLSMTAIYGASQVVAQPGNVLPQQQHSQVGPQINDYSHRVGPSSFVHPRTHPVHDPQAGGYGS